MLSRRLISDIFRRAKVISMTDFEIDFSTAVSRRTFPGRDVVTLSRENEPIERLRCQLAYSRQTGVSYITLDDEVEDFD